jgi:hypothetical protein
MVTRVRLLLGGALVAAALMPGSDAGATSTATLRTDIFHRTTRDDAVAARDAFLASNIVSNFHLETFNGFKAWDGVSGTSDPQNTAIGSFSGIGKEKGSGYTAVNGGKHVEVRSLGNRAFRTSGRFNPERINQNYLDSNDKRGVKVEVSGIGKFNALAFFLVDVADEGATFSIHAGKQKFSAIAGADGELRNSSILFVRILLDKAVSNLTVRFKHNKTNDGFGIAGAMAAKITPIPLPAGGWLLLAGLGGLGALARRRIPAT